MSDQKKYIILKDGNVPFSKVVADCSGGLCVPVSKGESLLSILKKICDKTAQEVTSDLSQYVKKSTVLSINGISQNLSSDREWVLDTDIIEEGSINLYYTDARARQAISLTVLGNTGPSTYDDTTGVLNIPTYTLAGLGYITPTLQQVTAAGATTTIPTTFSATLTTPVLYIKNSINSFTSMISTANLVTANRTLTAPNASGYIALSVNNVLADGNGNISLTTEDLSDIDGLYFKQGGNSFGEIATLGTLDQHNLNLQAFGTRVLGILHNRCIEAYGNGDNITLTFQPTGALSISGVNDFGSGYEASGIFDLAQNGRLTITGLFNNSGTTGYFTKLVSGDGGAFQISSLKGDSLSYALRFYIDDSADRVAVGFTDDTYIALNNAVDDYTDIFHVLVRNQNTGYMEKILAEDLISNFATLDTVTTAGNTTLNGIEVGSVLVGAVPVSGNYGTIGYIAATSSNDRPAIHGFTSYSGGAAVYGETDSGYGIFGYATGIGAYSAVHGESTGGAYAVSGLNNGGIAARFQGSTPLQITSNAFDASFKTDNLLASRTYQAPNASGILLLSVNSIISDNAGNVSLTTTDIPQGSNIYYTDALARASISLTVTGSSGASTYNSSTGVLNIPTYTAAGLGAVTTLAAIGAVPNANGATISGSTLNLQPADASFGGVVTTGTQTFAGAKTFTGLLTVNNDITVDTVNRTLSVSRISTFSAATRLLLIGAASDATNGASVVIGAVSSTTSANNVLTVAQTFNPSTGSNAHTTLFLNSAITTTGSYTGTVRGIYYNPTISLVGTTVHRAIETVTGDVYIASTSGNMGIGIAPSSTFKLDVSGTGRYAQTTGNPTLTVNNTGNSSSSGVLSCTAVSGGFMFFGGSGGLMVGGGSAGGAGPIAQVKIRVIATSGQTAAVQTWENSSNVAMSFIDATGKLILGNSSSTGEMLQVTGTGKITGTLTLGVASTTAGRIELMRTTGGAAGFVYMSGNLMVIENSSTSIELRPTSTANVFSVLSTGNTVLSSTGALTDQASALLTMNSTTKGFLPPRMTGVQAEAISSPAEGLLVYSTDGTGVTITSKGWWGYNGTTWNKLN